MCYSEGKKEGYEYLKMLTIESKEELLKYCVGDEIMEKYKEEVIKLNRDNAFIDDLTKEEDDELIRQSEILYARDDKAIEIAKNMLGKGLDISFISEVTGLSIEKVEKLN